MSMYVCSDLHGNGFLWEQIKEFLKPDDFLFYLGDATDRGLDGWKILKEMLADERVGYIPGNHDLMLADRIERPNVSRYVNLHNLNGGAPTWAAAENDPEAKEIAKKIRKLPLTAYYVNADGVKIFMSHSGSTNMECEHDLVWDRTEFITTKNDTKFDVIIHGHTTIPHLIEDLKDFKAFYPEMPEIEKWEHGAYWYHGFRCDIDCYTVKTGETVLLDLDTFEEHIFIQEGYVWSPV